MAGTEKNSIMKYVHIAIALSLMFVWGNVIPAPYPMTEVGMQVLMIFAGVVYSWMFIGFLWPTLLGLVAIGLSGFVTASTMNGVWSASFGGSVPMLLLFSMILFGNVEEVGATKYITRFFLTRKALNGRPIVFAALFFFATYALSLAVNVTPSLLLMWAVLYGILKDLGYKKGEKFTNFMIVGTFLGAISGQATLPFTGSTLAIINSFDTAIYNITGASDNLPYIPYIILGLLISIIGIVGYAVFMKIVCKKEDLAKVANINTDMFTKDPLPPMNLIQKINFYSMFVFMFMLLAPDFLPESWWLTQTLGKMAPAGVAIFLIAILCILKVKGEPVFDFPVVAKKYINWDVYVMVAGAMYMGSALTNEATGVTQWMVVVFEPILGGHSPFMFFAIMLIFGIVATTFASSLVIGVAIMPILVYFGIQSGANVQAVTAITTLLIHYQIILPSASVFAAMLWGNDEWITPKEVFKHAAFLVIFATAVSFILIPLANLLF